MKRWTSALVVLAVLPACGAALAAELVFPNLTGRVVDEAGLLDAAQETALAAKLQALEEKTTDQLVIVTLSSLQDTSIEDFGYQLGRHWAIGQKDKNNGVLLIVAPNERTVRIEVGYGLEGTLTDALTKIIIETSILPRFRAGDMAGGIMAGADDVISALTGDAAAIAERAATRPEVKDELFAMVFPVMIFLFVILIFILIWRGGTTGGRWSSGSSSGGSWSSSGGGFSGGGGSFGGGGSSGSW
ncbi:MAG: TPM domain-containing protein [Hyphomicrobiales bacterium]|jgi:uncharacterized protein|nr:TPM domain-containing protein [Hyphomicrobiales bacterium]